MPTRAENNVAEQIENARRSGNVGATAMAMATHELGRQQRASNMLLLAAQLAGKEQSTLQEKAIVQHLQQAAAVIIGMRQDGSVPD